jgi:uncharacterized membrane protein
MFGTVSQDQSAATSEFPGMDRLKFFSDAVFAIAITLLILNVDLPPGTLGSNLAHQLDVIWPEYAAFAFTFLLIGLRWLTHLIQFRYIRSYDNMILGLNLGLLFVVAFLPFASRVLAEYPNSRPACVLYGGSMTVAGILSSLLWWHAWHSKRLVNAPELDHYACGNLMLRWAALPVFFSIAIILALLGSNLWIARGFALATLVAQGVITICARRTGHQI